MLIISGPSCSGKNVLLDQLLEARSQLRKPTTTTTRPPREGEVDGQDYHFLSREEFLDKVEQGDFLEYAEVHGDHLYGLTRDEIEDIHQRGHFPAVILDVQGAATIRENMPAATIFIQAPVEDLKRRMRQERPDREVEKRLGSMLEELGRAEEFDVVIKNPDGERDRAMQALIDYYDREVQPRLEAFRQSESGHRARADQPPVIGS